LYYCNEMNAMSIRVWISLIVGQTLHFKQL
jgi:hypothetical protein